MLCGAAARLQSLLPRQNRQPKDLVNTTGAHSPETRAAGLNATKAPFMGGTPTRWVNNSVAEAGWCSAPKTRAVLKQDELMVRLRFRKTLLTSGRRFSLGGNMTQLCAYYRGGAVRRRRLISNRVRRGLRRSSPGMPAWVCLQRCGR